MICVHGLTRNSRDFDFQTFDPTNLDGYTLATIRAAVPIGDHFELYGRIENLFDAKVVSGISAGGIEDLGTPQTFWLGLTFGR